MDSMDQEIKQLTEEVAELRIKLEEALRESGNVKDSPYIQASVRSLVYEVNLDREKIMADEFGQKINERLGTMTEIKNQARRLADLIGLDSDMIRILVTEAVQNIIEHGHGKTVTVRLEVDNNEINPSLTCSFKNLLPPGEVYTLKDINQNALKGDLTSGYFDFEDPRGRGEFIIRQLTDERRIINGIEIDREGNKVNYFKRILINYKNPQGERNRLGFHEMKHEIDRLDYEDVVCLFHISHLPERHEIITVAATQANSDKVNQIMSESGYQLINKDKYYRTVFLSYDVNHEYDKDELLDLFKRVRKVVYQEYDQPSQEIPVIFSE
jgi:hypothetical protein